MSEQKSKSFKIGELVESKIKNRQTSEYDNLTIAIKE